MKIFISYSTKDLEEFKIKEIVSFLEKETDIEKVYYWNRDGADFQSTVIYMEHCLPLSDILIAVCTKNSLESKAVNQEVILAIYNGKRIIPIYKDRKYVREGLKPMTGVVFHHDFNLFIKNLKNVVFGVNEIKPETIFNKLELEEFHGIQIIRPQYEILKKLELLLGEIPRVSKVKWDTFGVTIVNNVITRLGLVNKGLEEIPIYIGQLTSLEKIDLSWNNLKSIPDSFKDLKRLRELYVVNNQIEYLPNIIGKLTSLEEIYIFGNQISFLPSSIGDLKSLIILWANNNKITNLPDTIGNLNNLRELDLEHNQLSILPNIFSKLTSLTNLNLQYNKISSLPKMFEKLVFLRELLLCGNRLTFLPEGIGELGSLKDLKLYWNKITELPDSIGNLSNLQFFSVSYNQLESLPIQITKLKKLQEFYFHDNNIKSLPKEIEIWLDYLRETGCDFIFPPKTDKIN